MKIKLFIISMILILAGCGKGDSNNPSPSGGNGGNTTPPSPATVLLSAPAQNAVCTTGTIINTTQTMVTFIWNASDNTDNYDLNFKNLLTGVSTTQNTAATSLAVSLLRNTPYSWYIVSRSGKTTSTTQSNTWKFYVAGLPTVSYAPYPADITTPGFGQSVTASSNTINLTWAGSDVDKNVKLNYDIYFDTINKPILLKSGVAEMFLNNVIVSSGKTYYWKIITKDANGNTSDSGLYVFTVN